MLVFLDNMSGRRKPVELDPSMQIFRIKDQIERIEYVQAQNQILVHNGTVMDRNARTLTEYGVTEGDTILVKICRYKRIYVLRVQHETVEGMKLCFLVCTKSMTAAQLKQLIYEDTDVKPENQKLMCEHEELVDGFPLAEQDADIGNKAVIKMFVVPEEPFQVHVRNIKNEIFVFDVLPSNFVIDLEDKIWDTEDIDPYEYDLVLDNNELNFEESLWEQGIRDGSKLFMRPQPSYYKGYDLFVKSPRFRYNVPMKFESLHLTVRALKNVLAMRKFIRAENMVLLHDGQVLDDDDKYLDDDYCIKPRCTVFISCFPAPNEIIVRNRSLDLELAITFEDTDTVEIIKNKVFLKTDIPTEKQRLFYNGTEMKNNARKIFFYRVDFKSKLDLVVREDWEC